MNTKEKIVNTVAWAAILAGGLAVSHYSSEDFDRALALTKHPGATCESLTPVQCTDTLNEANHNADRDAAFAVGGLLLEIGGIVRLGTRLGQISARQLMRCRQQV